MEIKKEDFLKMVAIISAGALANPANGPTADQYQTQNIIQNVVYGVQNAMSIVGSVLVD